MTKGKLTKGNLSLGNVSKDNVNHAKSDLVAKERRTTIYLDERIYLALKKYCAGEDIKIKDYMNNLFLEDLKNKGLM